MKVKNKRWRHHDAAALYADALCGIQIAFCV
jgi:hypothetical protein